MVETASCGDADECDGGEWDEDVEEAQIPEMEEVIQHATSLPALM